MRPLSFLYIVVALYARPGYEANIVDDVLFSTSKREKMVNRLIMCAAVLSNLFHGTWGYKPTRSKLHLFK